MKATDKQKLTPFQFDLAVNTHLDGVNFLEIINGVSLEKDKEGNLKDSVLKSLKTCFRAAVKSAPKNGAAKRKLQNMSNFLESY